MSNENKVVLPEPDAVISEVMGLVDEWGMESHLRGEAELDAQHPEATQEEIDCARDRASKERAAWKAIESKLRALLATATGLPAQADARDAEQEVLMEHSGCGSNTQVDMLTVRLNPGDKVVMHKGRITQGFDRANRAAIAAAKGNE